VRHQRPEGRRSHVLAHQLRPARLGLPLREQLPLRRQLRASRLHVFRLRERETRWFVAQFGSLSSSPFLPAVAAVRSKTRFLTPTGTDRPSTSTATTTTPPSTPAPRRSPTMGSTRTVTART